MSSRNKEIVVLDLRGLGQNDQMDYLLHGSSIKVIDAIVNAGQKLLNILYSYQRKPTDNTDLVCILLIHHHGEQQCQVLFDSTTGESHAVNYKQAKDNLQALLLLGATDQSAWPALPGTIRDVQSPLRPQDESSRWQNEVLFAVDAVQSQIKTIPFQTSKCLYLAALGNESLMKALLQGVEPCLCEFTFGLVLSSPAQCPDYEKLAQLVHETCPTHQLCKVMAEPWALRTFLSRSILDLCVVYNTLHMGSLPIQLSLWPRAIPFLGSNGNNLVWSIDAIPNLQVVSRIPIMSLSDDLFQGCSWLAYPKYDDLDAEEQNPSVFFSLLQELNTKDEALCVKSAKRDAGCFVFYIAIPGRDSMLLRQISTDDAVLPYPVSNPFSGSIQAVNDLVSTELASFAFKDFDPVNYCSNLHPTIEATLNIEHIDEDPNFVFPVAKPRSRSMKPVVTRTKQRGKVLHSGTGRFAMNSRSKC